MKKKPSGHINRVTLGDDGVVGTGGDPNILAIESTTSRVNIKTGEDLGEELGKRKKKEKKRKDLVRAGIKTKDNLDMTERIFTDNTDSMSRAETHNLKFKGEEES